MDELKEVEARYCKDLTLCQTKVKEFQVSETKCESDHRFYRTDMPSLSDIHHI
jgi:Uri superfamily endonuclease